MFSPQPLSLFILTKMFLQELDSINDEALLMRIQDVLDERVKPVKGKIGMQRQRFRAIKIGVDLMLDVCRRTHNDLETELEGESFPSTAIQLRLYTCDDSCGRACFCPLCVLWLLLLVCTALEFGILILLCWPIDPIVEISMAIARRAIQTKMAVGRFFFFSFLTFFLFLFGDTWTFARLLGPV